MLSFAIIESFTVIYRHLPEMLSFVNNVVICPHASPMDSGTMSVNVSLENGRNLVRRHLSESQRGMVAGKVANMHRGRPDELNPSIDGFTQEDAAQMLNVGESTVTRARTVINKGTPELIKAVESGEVTVNAAAQIAKLPAARQVEVMAEGLEAIKEMPRSSE